MPRYKVNIEGQPFRFEWSKPEKPTREEILDLYSLQKKGLDRGVSSHEVETPTPSEGLFSRMYRRATTPLMDIPDWGKSEGFFGDIQRTIDPTTSHIGRLANFINTRGVEPATSPLGIASIPLAATRFGQLALGAAGTGFGIASSPEAVTRAVNEPSFENIGDAALSVSSLAAGPLAVRRSILNATRPRATPSIGVDELNTRVASEQASRDLARDIAIRGRGSVANLDVSNDIKVPRLGDRATNSANPMRPQPLDPDSAVEGLGTYGIKSDRMDPQTGVNIRPSMRQSTNQKVFDALLPSRTKELIGQTRPKMSVSHEAKIPDVIPEPEQPIIIKAASSNNPILKEAANGVANIESKNAGGVQGKGGRKDFKGRVKTVTENFAKSGISVLEDDSPAGKDISRLIQKTRAIGDQYGGTWSNRFKNEVLKGLDDNDWETLRLAKEGKLKLEGGDLQNRLDKWNALDNEVVSKSKNVGMKMETYAGDVVDFEGNENYFPRIYPEEFLSGKKKDIFDELVSQGHSAKEAESIIENSRKFGHRLISPQHKRHADIPGYRTDKDAYIKHLDDMGKRIAETEYLGARDLGDVNSPLSQLLTKTNDKERIRQILEKHLGRVPVNEDAQKVANAISKYQAATKLGLFAISNQANKATIPIRSNLSGFYKAVKEYKTSAGKDFAEQSGALQSALRDVVNEVGGEGLISKLYRTGASERANRGLASISGKYTAQDLFLKLKKGKPSKGDKDRLSDLLYESPDNLDSILSQDKLTDQQLGLAGSRMSEITQGRAGSIDLPAYWTAHPMMNVLTMFKKYAFRQTKMLSDAARENPVKFISFGLPLLALTGEAIGDTKATIRGVISGEDISEQIASRGLDDGIVRTLMSQTGSKSLADLSGRIAENLSEAWTLGILGDLIESSGYQGGMLRFLAGPTLGQADKLSSGVGKAVRGNIRPLASHAVEAVVPSPFGNPLGKRIRGERESRRMLPSLPRVTR